MTKLAIPIFIVSIGTIIYGYKTLRRADKAIEGPASVCPSSNETEQRRDSHEDIGHLKKVNAALRNTIAHLRYELSQLRSSVDENDRKRAEAIVAHDSTAPAMTTEEQESRLASEEKEQIVTYEKRLNEEGYKEATSAEALAAIEKALADSDAADLKLLSVDCGKNICRVEVTPDYSDDKALSFLKRASDHMPLTNASVFIPQQASNRAPDSRVAYYSSGN